MNHAEHAYHETGYRLERTASSATRIKLYKKVLSMIESETLDDQYHARQLVERGRKEAQLNANH